MAGKRNSISMWKKKEVVDWINSEGDGVASRATAHFRTLGWSLDPALARRWWRQREEKWAARPTQQRVSGGGRKPALGELEDLLLESIVLRRLKKEKVTREWIAGQTLQLYNEIHDGRTRLFEASPNWVSGFMKRNDLSLRRRNNLTTLSDDQLVGRAVSYMNYLCEKKLNFNFRHTVVMDETAVYFEDAREHTVEIRGSRHVMVKSTGFASMRVTAVLAVTAAGVKLPPLVIWKHNSVERSETFMCIFPMKRRTSFGDETLSLEMDKIQVLTRLEAPSAKLISS
ncbi:hypothetical protein PR003_g3341 [Phytophthora rubi]|uniref:HTH CENPB-type domain-containing protein n=1 Tax=Phytophthora rubi TaxID=129364 RepID=A0A6A3P6V6_9STRA|nr:hypothetical protein PR001_g3436 [Phytophthora rubi]KAE9354448.1 hypothetical protein PR003_g3341 [Phytophthora rubi]